MLILLLLEILFYLSPLLLIAYAVFLLVKTPLPRPKGFAVKLLIYTVPSLVLIHIAFVFTEGEKISVNERKALRNGIYINAELGDTVKLAGDSVYIMYGSKAKKIDAMTTADTVAQAGKGKKSKKSRKLRVQISESHEDIASTYTMAADTIELFSKGWNKKEYTDNINHFFRKAPISGNVTGVMVIKNEASGKQSLHYGFSLQNDSLSLDNRNNKSQPVLYLKQNSANVRPATTK